MILFHNIILFTFGIKFDSVLMLFEYCLFGNRSYDMKFDFI